MHACVIGAGVIGVTTAWQLARQGWRVTLVDAAAEPAGGASHANGGQLSYSYVAPLAEPGVLPHLPVWLFNPASPLRFRPRLDPLQWRWCLQFLRACNGRTASATSAQLLSLSYLSRQVLHDIQRESPVDFAHARNGKLIVYRTPALLEKARAQVALQAQMGSDQQILDADQLIEREPALAPVRSRLAGAVYTPSEESGDCARFTQGLFQQMAAMDHVTLRMQTPIGQLERSGGRIRRLLTTTGESIEADQYVVAAGMGSRPLLAALGTHAPLYPLKGYSLSLPCTPDQAPAISVTDYERKTVYANLGGTLRIAAMVGIGVADHGIEADRIALVKQQASELLPRADIKQARAWAGYRPATPHGRPLIGRSRAAGNLWLNIGHGALGFTLACGSSHLLGRLMAGATPDIDPVPFQPNC
ncbi:D-amino acid dehydrogenase [Castellaniella sp.]|uniref:D-amino acid dehydrogenase n=1 Tax=Castellaniella sp. TaxID=1955812 RepID=UPI002AFE1A23|nr:D-amino acid dehydrogenase [Castellaniella sp.]